LRLRTLPDLDLLGRRVLVRVDFNVPLQQGHVADDTRIRAALPTLRYIRDRNAKAVLMSHLGRPKGRIVAELRLDPVAHSLSRLLHCPVAKLPETVGASVESAIQGMNTGDVVLLENLRFHPGEEANDPAFAQDLARLGDVFVNDAFGTVHRAHASTYGVAQQLPSAAGLLLAREVQMLSPLLDAPARPYWAMVGGTKLSDKIQVLRDLLPRVNGFLIGGGVAFTFLKAKELPVGKSIVDEKMISEVRRFLKEAQTQGVDVVLPEDVVVASERKTHVPTQVVQVDQIPQDWMGLDIGPKTIRAFQDCLKSVKTLVWAGPLGAFETPPFGEGTFQVARAIAQSPELYAVIGGGDTASALKADGIAAQNIYVSTGGGATLEFLGGRKLPALEVLRV
jgi:phosphoglycerate kinase